MDPQIELLIPRNDCDDPEISIVVPALNESLTIAEFIDWCLEGLAKAGVKGEILIVDSSSDNTAEIAVQKGARVLKTPKRGLGRAYIDAQPYIRGKFFVLGDCDCTYDFRELKPFVDAYRSGAEFVMGSRFKGVIDEGSMPPLHRYFGTPLTTWILNQIFRSKFSDIHCGMRGLTRDAYARLDLRSQSWEYASEMVIKSVHLNLRTTEVPIHFLKDKEGRLSHHKRSGWFSPWHAGWINLRAMFIYGADYFLTRPGWLLFLLGLLLVFPIVGGVRQVGPVQLSLNWMLLGTTMTAIGLQSIYMGGLARCLYDSTGHTTGLWLKRLHYDRTVIGCGVGFVAGLGLCVPLVVQYVRQGLSIAEVTNANYWAVFGLALMICVFMTFTSTLLLHAVAAYQRRT